MAVVVCSQPGCPSLTPKGKCERHRTPRRSARERGYTRRWELFRLEFLKANPICEVVDCDQAATDVDHRDGLGPQGPRGFDKANCRAFCHSHHSQRTARDQPGGFNAQR